jgi:hypothetical protein
VDFRRPVEALIPDAHGRVLGVLARTTEEMSLTTLADLSGVSLAHTARIVPRLVDLGVLERREVPPAVLVRLARENLAARCIVELAGLRQDLLDELSASARLIEPTAASVILFGSFARGDDDADSDIDVLLVRPAATDADDPAWLDSVASWEAHVTRRSGNPVNRLEVGEDEAAKLVRSRRPLWRSIREEGLTLRGRPLIELGAATRG